jgi:hypothetical protein
MDATNFTDAFLVQTNSDGSAPTTGTLSSANWNVGIGKDVFSSLTSGDANVAFGVNALKYTTSGGSLVAIGQNALERNTTENGNIGIGTQAMGGAYGQTATGAYNVAIGYNAIRYGAQDNGSYNIGIGYKALESTNGNASGATYNVGIGYESLQENTSGDNNTAVGYKTLHSNATGNRNVAMGYAAMDAGDGDDNVAIGASALSAALNNGDKNTAIGGQALNDVTSGDSNIGVGYGAGDNITTGSRNVVIGDWPVDSATSDSQLKIGDGAGVVLWLDGDSTGVAAPKIRTKIITSTPVTLLATESGFYVSLGSGSSTVNLPDDCVAGQQFTIVNDSGATKTIGAGTNNSFATGYTGSIDDESAKSFICFSNGKWHAIG